MAETTENNLAVQMALVLKRYYGDSVEFEIDPHAITGKLQWFDEEFRITFTVWAAAQGETEEVTGHGAKSTIL